MIGSGLIWKFVKWHKVLGDKLAIRLFDRPLPPPTPRESELGEALKEELINSPEASVLPKWTIFREAIRRDISAHDPRSFLRWPLVQHTMCVTNSGAVIRELLALKASPRWPDFRRAVVESPVGHPIRYLYHPESSGNLLHHCYHLMRFEEATGLDLRALETVVEFGGGYGSMCRLFYRLGFAGRYYIYDLPEFSALQRYFLGNLELPVQARGTDAAADGTHLLTDMEKVRGALDARPPQGGRMFIATWSLSESPVEVREKFLPLIQSFDYFLIAFQDLFETVDNLAWFEAFARSTSAEIRWMPKALRHLPRNNYLFGQRLCATN